jgi:cytochrome c oxidase subunit 2
LDSVSGFGYGAPAASGGVAGWPKGLESMAIAIALVLVVYGSVLFHLLSPWWWTPIASNWSYIDHTLVITFWITGLVFAAVVLFMAYCVFRFRHREGARAAYEPENKRLESWLTVVTAIGVAAMLTPGLFVWASFVRVPETAKEVEVVASQWSWSYRLPGDDGALGRSDPRLIGVDNPLGVDPDDPAGADDVIVEADDLHLQVDQPIKVLLRSIDVLHNYYVPEFRAKMDMVPGMITYFWFTPTRTGQFEVLCAELCGVGHPYMRGAVIVDAEADYQAWLGQQSTFAALAPPTRLGAVEPEAAAEGSQ